MYSEHTDQQKEEKMMMIMQERHCIDRSRIGIVLRTAMEDISPITLRKDIMN